jgi:transcriptional regulator with XRE-family HTH domain
MTTAIKRYLSEHSIKQTDMAKQLGINPATMSKIVRGERMPRIDVVERIEIATFGDVGPRHFYKNPDVWSEVSNLEDAKWAKENIDRKKSAELEDASFEEDLNDDLIPFQELSSWGKLKRLFGG